MNADLDDIFVTFRDVAAAIEGKINNGVSWEDADGHVGQFRGDVVADQIALDILLDRGYRVFSEESGNTDGMDESDSKITVVVDPVDGSTNAALGIPFYAVSLCALNGNEPLFGFVMNLSNGVTYHAPRGGRSFKNGNLIYPSKVSYLRDAVIGVNGYPESHFGWAQFRAFGSSALELCMVAEGALDGFVDLSDEKLASWDVLAGVMICQAAGACVLQSDGREFEISDLSERSQIVAAGNRSLAEELLAKAVR